MGKLMRRIQIFNQISKILIGCYGNQETMGKNLVFLGKANFHKLTFQTTHSKIFTLHRYHRVQVSIQFFDFCTLRLFTDNIMSQISKKAVFAKEVSCFLVSNLQTGQYIYILYRYLHSPASDHQFDIQHDRFHFHFHYY